MLNVSIILQTFANSLDRLIYIVLAAVINSPIAVYLGDTLQYRLKENVSHQRTRQMTKLFTYLLTYMLFSPCIWQYLVPRACDWVILNVICRVTYFQFPVQSAFQYISLTWPHQLWLWAAPALQCTIGQYWITDVAENLGKSLSGMQQTDHGKDWSDSNGKNGN